MTAPELAVMLSLSGPVVTAAEVSGVLAAHPAFTPGEEGFILGRPADVRMIISGIQPGAPVPGTVVRPIGPVRTQGVPQPAIS